MKIDPIIAWGFRVKRGMTGVRLSCLRAFAFSPLRAFVPSRLRAFAFSRLRPFVPSCLHAFAPSRLRPFAPSRPLPSPFSFSPFLLFSLLLFSLLPCTLQAQTRAFHNKIKGNGKLITKSIPISNFSKIEIGSRVNVNFSQAPNTGSLEFTIDDNLIDYFDIYTKDSVLYIEIAKEYMENGIYLDLFPKKSIITVSSEQLENIKMRGSGIINFSTAFTSKFLNIEGRGKLLANKYPVQIEQLKIATTGSSNIQLAGTIQQADIQIKGSGNVQLVGAIQQARVQISGSGSVKALKCEIAQMQINLSGSGSVEAYVTDKLDINLRGRGSVYFKGDPYPFTKNIAGSGTVKKL